MENEERPDALPLSWVDGRGRTVTRQIKQTVDIRDFRGMAGYAWLLMGANPRLSSPDLERWQQLQAREFPKQRRRAEWFRKRRKMFRSAGVLGRPGGVRDADGMERRALRILAENQTLSARSLSLLLKEHGIRRGREWIREHK